MSNTKEFNGTSRRSFLTSAGKAIAGGMAVTGLIGAAQGEESKPCMSSSLPAKWDESYDVVIIGSGFAGLAAAYEAKKAGSSVVILEKMRTAGGNSIINGGGFAAAGTPIQAAQGLKDSSELLATDMIREGLGLNHPELVKIVSEQSWPVVKWTIDEFGVKYADHLMHEGGHSVPRSYMTPSESGSDVVNAMLAKLQTMGIEVRTQIYVQKILRDGVAGRTHGVRIPEGRQRKSKKHSGEEGRNSWLWRVRTGRCVPLATGSEAHRNDGLHESTGRDGRAVARVSARGRHTHPIELDSGGTVGKS